ncbi:MAG: serine hydroxymethyltransferase [Chloroflexi bacterium]|nr:serine hydroxymethyltransferase [Chloroflexota bacterium]
MSPIARQDPEVASTIAAEERRLREEVVLIASENYASANVLAATGSVFTYKYAEGYPGRRYYAGCENCDDIERLAIDRVNELFGTDHANVQPHSGSGANLAAYAALLKPGDRILGMRLDQGGHLTHGSPVNFSGQLYEFAAYGVDRETETIDYDEVERVAREFRPKMIVTGATAYPRLIDFERFKAVADDVGATLLADIAHIAGLVAAGVHPSPVPHADIVTSTTHKTLRGPRGAVALCKANHARALDRAVFPYSQGGPLMHVIAAKAVAFGEALRPEFKDYARAIVENARSLARALAAGGLRIVSGGTDNHLMLVDLQPLSMTGLDAQNALKAAGIVANRNSVPFDPQSPRVTSGVRLGTPAVTSRGMTVADMGRVAGFILEALRASGDAAELQRVRTRVTEFASGFPVPGLDDANG